MVTVVAALRWPDAALIGVPGTGVAWSVGVWLAAGEHIAELGAGQARALALISVGGIAQALALWVGFCGVLWAMARLARLGLSFPQLLSLVSAATLPLWLAAPAGAFWLSRGATPIDAPLLAGVAFAGSAGFLVLLARRLSAASGLPAWQGGMCVAATCGFLASFAVLAA